MSSELRVTIKKSKATEHNNIEIAIAELWSWAREWMNGLLNAELIYYIYFFFYLLPTESISDITYYNTNKISIYLSVCTVFGLLLTAMLNVQEHQIVSRSTMWDIVLQSNKPIFRIITYFELHFSLSDERSRRKKSSSNKIMWKMRRRNPWFTFTRLRFLSISCCDFVFFFFSFFSLFNILFSVSSC